MLDQLLRDLADEHAALDRIVETLGEEDWSAATPAEGWSVRDQISHLTFFDQTARLAIVDPDRFTAHAATVVAGDRDTIGDVDLGRTVCGAELLDAWRAARTDLLDAARSATAERIPWYAQPMSLASFVTARLMETWAHGQDVVDALGTDPVVSDRLRHVCDLGVRARRFSFAVNARPDPGQPVRVEVAAPSGSLWVWGDGQAADRVTGSALDFALVVTRRRHLLDTNLSAIGATTAAWLAVAQTFAGPPGPVRPPGLARATR